MAPEQIADEMLDAPMHMLMMSTSMPRALSRSLSLSARTINQYPFAQSCQFVGYFARANTHTRVGPHRKLKSLTNWMPAQLEDYCLLAARLSVRPSVEHFHCECNYISAAYISVYNCPSSMCVCVLYYQFRVDYYFLCVMLRGHMWSAQIGFVQCTFWLSGIFRCGY